MRSIRIDDVGQLRPQMKAAWEIACEAIKGGKIAIEIKRWSRSREQEKKFHAMIQDISRQVSFDYDVDPDEGNVIRMFGTRRRKSYSLDVWKALLVEQFAREKEAMGEPLRHQGQTIISLDGRREITVRPSTTQFLVNEASEFIEYLYMKGTEFGVHWSEPALRVYQEYREAKAA
ncbi:recombination protein NinB [uncultured Amphritea sp.]|uniref:recombination protein NinB n=1 Tax=uncultured Amphritea sp. TaxID=981605 RepID=UPI00261F683D|nr:recombination protein NinB [uncultured Amphritea sp.]